MSDLKSSSVLVDSSKQSSTLSVSEHFEGKHILLTGVTGSVGNVLLTMITTYLPKTRKISVFIRPNQRYDNAKSRFQK